ncbi:MAG: arginine decarboxylase, pyruvoyl-dependent, partial [Halobacteria archaeon]|nr:arginine decarboxylase, pyruvoyl-dependent [Halobacteria archaeon]
MEGGSYVPSKLFLTSGVGEHTREVASFEFALRDAGIEEYNIVPVSSIFPPEAEVVDIEEGREELSSGQIVHAVLSRCSTEEPVPIQSAVGAARPSSGHGYLIEECAEDHETDLGAVAESLASELVKGDVSERFSVSAKTEGERGKWTTAVAAAVLVVPLGWLLVDVLGLG